MTTRRQFLRASASAATAASVLSHSSLSASLARLAINDGESFEGKSRRLSSGWEYFQGSLGGPWEVWHSDEVVSFATVAMPHCFNAYDGCDPDVPAYRGPGWYRTHVPIANPYPNGRTLLHFEGAGQDTTVYVGDALVGKHIGGYDEFVFDITDAVAKLPSPALNPKKKKTADGIPLAVLCDNSRDLDRMPSDLSDFTLYGGLYRHLNLVYVPGVSIETVHIKTNLATPKSPAKVEIVASLYNPDRKSVV